MNKNKNKFWDKLSLFQKRVMLVVGVITATSFFYPIFVSAIQEMSSFIRFYKRRDYYEEQIRILRDYMEVDKGFSKAQMEKIDTTNRYVWVEINGKIKEIKADIRKQELGDYKIYVDDGDVGMYGTYFNFSLGEWEYYDFKENKHYVTHTKD